MKLTTVFAVLAIVCMMNLAAYAETTVTLTDVHMCCNACVNGVPAATKDVTGAKAVGSRDAKNIVITAPDTATAQKAVDALLVAGYFGKSSDAGIKVEAPSGAKDEKVKTLTVSGTHLCCGNCVTAVKGILGKIEGVEGNTVVQKAPTFNVTGDFNAKKVFDELNKGGLAGKVASPAPAP